jgi:AcrR family transcriptional regulator
MGVQERRNRDKENLREEILDAARTLIAKEGYENLSIRKIAERIEYSPGTIYLYFKDKSEIVGEICDQTFTKLDQNLSAIVADNGDPLEALRRGLRTYAMFGIENPDHYIITFMQRMPEQMTPQEDGPGVRSFGCLRARVRAAVDAGVTRSQDVEEIAQTLWAGIHGVTALLVIKCGFPFIERTRLVESTIDVLIEGIRRK